MNHTPGPWYFHHDDASERPGLEDEIVSVPTKHIVATVYLVGSQVHPWRENAALIAAAPDLLAGCKAALGAFERNDAIDWDELRKAIEKAEGRLS